MTTVKTFDQAPNSHFEQFGLDLADKELFLRVQEKHLVKNDLTVELGMGGAVAFNDMGGYDHDDLIKLHQAQIRSEKGRDEMEKRGLLDQEGAVVVMPIIDPEGDVNPVFFLPGAPEKIKKVASSLRKNILDSKEGVYIPGGERSFK